MTVAELEGQACAASNGVRRNPLRDRVPEPTGLRPDDERSGCRLHCGRGGVEAREHRAWALSSTERVVSFARGAWSPFPTQKRGRLRLTSTGPKLNVPLCRRVQTEGPTWEFNLESGALGVARCPSGALSGALIRASSGTVWSRDLQGSRGQCPPPAARERCANPS
eukprot:scaffold5625_cov65-Phaeocystis_antarctica.AAC.3